MRMLRLVLGVAILVQGVVVTDTITIILGMIIAGTAVAKIGCCGTNGCAVDTPSIKQNTRIDHEELDLKK